MNQLTNKKGFTIIEVVLVLAIAALIFLMIFVAFPALQRGQKNTARKNDLSTIAAAINTYRSNQNGNVPTSYPSISNYIDKLSQIDNSADGITFPDGSNAPAKDGTSLDKAWIYTKAECNNDGTPKAVSSSKAMAVVTVVQVSASGYDYVCQGV